ncbi:MAG: hydrolase, partial [Catenulispora sp.]|nr:hydrolase [Catenulispora sp.]
AGGPAEQTFSALDGLQLRPRRLRDASRLWASLADARGLEGRDAIWSHPDLLPTSADLDDPDGFVHGRDDSEDGMEFDFSGLDALLEGGIEGTGSGKKTEESGEAGESGKTGESGQATEPEQPEQDARGEKDSDAEGGEDKPKQ